MEEVAWAPRLYQHYGCVTGSSHTRGRLDLVGKYRADANWGTMAYTPQSQPRPWSPIAKNLTKAALRSTFANRPTRQADPGEAKKA